MPKGKSSQLTARGEYYINPLVCSIYRRARMGMSLPLIYPSGLLTTVTNHAKKVVEAGEKIKRLQAFVAI